MSITSKKVDVRPIHIDYLRGLCRDFNTMKGIHNLIAENVLDDDRYDVMDRLVEEEDIFLRDNESHLLTILKTKLKSGAR